MNEEMIVKVLSLSYEGSFNNKRETQYQGDICMIETQYCVDIFVFEIAHFCDLGST